MPAHACPTCGMEHNTEGVICRVLPTSLAGSCNFCTRDSGTVLEIRGRDTPGGSLSVRICPPCAKDLKTALSNYTR